MRGGPSLQSHRARNRQRQRHLAPARVSNHELGEVERVTPTADTASSHSTGLRDTQHGS
ncbi:hypothetical protein Isop_2177 [Isosphaera pallida ATCC 43644]|uniref:Uncharacterized protein n=1 Tax=Isosphaera pallida (strain ATCC 43644 / DSM 9630 / IS1B) TaxID=575540 RepID=E8R4Z9_ISOPI|nr:hypothetical protein Isop_2177 [Isosphaera pallida ATCC 43644]